MTTCARAPLALVIAALVTSAYACGAPAADTASGATDVPHATPDLIVLSDAARARGGIVVEPPRQVTWRDRVEAPGLVTLNETRTARVGSLAEGLVVQLLVQPVGLDDTPRGTPLLAVDSVGAGVHEKVLVVIEGRAAGEALGRKAAPVDAAIIGIVDHVDAQE